MSPTLLVFSAEALAVPTGLITVIFLLHMFGAERYGAYAVSLVVIGWVQVVLSSLLGRAAQTFTARAADWKPVAADVVVLHLLVGALGTAAVLVLAQPLSHLLRLPALALNLTVAAIDIVLFITGQGCRSVAMATERFALRAVMATIRWLSRPILIVLLVWAGFGVTGAILGGVGASACELVFALAWLRLPIPKIGFSELKGFWRMAAPLSVSALGLRLFEKVDLLVVQGLAGPVAAGLYAAAQNVSIVAGIFGMSYGGVIITRVTQLRSDAAAVAQAARDAMKVCLRLAPPATIGAFCAPQIVQLAMGPQFTAAAPILAVLAGAALAMVWLGAATALLTGAGYGRLVLLVTAAALPVALAGHFVLVPIFGPLGAAVCTLTVGFATAIAAWSVVLWRLGSAPPWATLIRNLAVCALVALAALWPPLHHLPSVAYVAVLAALAAAALLALGEITKADLSLWTRGLVFWRASAA